MKVVSINVGQPREVQWRGERVMTSIWKSPVSGRIRASGVNLENDRQSDLEVHGGPRKAVYVYPSEHYEYWRRELDEPALTWGAFGENLTTEGLLEADVAVGDELRIGSARFVITQPRWPCFKLDIRFGREGVVRRFLQSRRLGFYLRIADPGEVGAGDGIEHIARGEGLTIATLAKSR